MSNRPSRFSSRINYALLHSTGTRQPLPAAAAESDSDSDDPTNMSVRSAEANRLPDEIARDVEQLMSLSEEELGQALRQAQEEGAELARRRKAEQVLAARKLNDELRTSSHRGSGRPAAVQRQPAPTPHRVDVHARFGPPSDTQPTLRDLEFLDHEADRVVRQQVGASYGFEGGLDRPIAEDYDRIPDYHLAILRQNTEYRIQNTEYFIVTLIIHVMQAKVLQAIKYITTYNT